ncbi:MAG TPA: fatty acid desaturase [Ramlibacter sp.]|nr:fatty acid desaturase [Ramlibacter sp.]
MRAILRNTLPLLALLWLAPHLADRSALAPWLLSPAIGLAIYRLTIVMHDCTHSTLFVGRRMNRALGSLLGACSGIDFVSFSKLHWQHHRSFGALDDPQRFHYADLKRMSRGEFMWHLFKPLLGLNLRHAFPESVIAPANLARLARTGELGVVVCVQALLLALVTGMGRYPVLALLPALSALTFGLFFSQLRGIAEHGSTGSTAEAGNVRSHAPNWLDRVVLYDLNFNYHAEHHENPHVPSCHLQAVHDADHDGCMPPTSMLGTLRAMYNGMRRSHA